MPSVCSSRTRFHLSLVLSLITRSPANLACPHPDPGLAVPLQPTTVVRRNMAHVKLVRLQRHTGCGVHSLLIHMQMVSVVLLLSIWLYVGEPTHPRGQGRAIEGAQLCCARAGERRQRDIGRLRPLLFDTSPSPFLTGVVLGR